MRNVLKEIAIGLMLGCAGFFAIVSFDARAQDKAATLTESSVVVYNAQVAIPAPDDGGCTIQVQGAASWSSGDIVNVTTGPKPFNGARCATVRAAMLRAVKLEFGVGDGGVP